MKPNLAEQLRSNLQRRKEQQTKLSPSFRVRGATAAEGEAAAEANTLRGEVAIAGAKNAALPLMIASLLTDEVVRLDNLPILTDVSILTKILIELGAEVELAPNAIRLRARHIKTNAPSPSLIKQMRASFWVLAPLLARTGAANVFLPGGDKIGTRAVDIYLNGLKALGANVEASAQKVNVAAKKLHGAAFRLSFPSVGATHVLLMAASLAQGETKLTNVAREPEIIALADMLQKMGARIEGAGSAEILIQGSASAHLRGADFTIPPDRIEAGTYMIAAALCGGEMKITGAPLKELAALLERLRAAEIPYHTTTDTMTITRAPNQPIAPVDITTAPYPAFPSDLQAQWMALMTKANGNSKITETLFENRFQHVGELNKLGAAIRIDGQTALIEGASPLYGNEIIATDIRASACLVLAALVAQGETLIRNIFHLERGFENMEHKFNACGANIERVSFQ